MKKSVIDFDINNKDLFLEKLKHYSDIYYTSQSSIHDKDFDELLSIYESKYGKYPIIRSEYALTKERVRLPVYMGSLDKFDTDDKIYNWNKKFTKPKIVTPKIDGTSLLIKFYAGKDKKINIYGNGTDNYALLMNFLIPYLKLPKLGELRNDIIVRGELIISIDNFKKYNSKLPTDKQYPTHLAYLTSIFNEKEINSEKCRYLEFIAYEQMYPIESSTSDRLDKLSKLGFKVVPYTPCPTIDRFILERIYTDYLEMYPYPIDGIVVYVNDTYKLATNQNPTYAFAYKRHFFKQVKVVKIVWKSNKSKITPTIYFEPFEWKVYEHENPKLYQKTTGHNARAIYDGKVGPGAIIGLRFNHPLWNWHRTVITQASQPQMPLGKWKWNDSHTEAIEIQESDDSNIKKIEYFIEKIGIKNLKEATIRKIYSSGKHNIVDFAKLSINDINHIDGIGEKTANRIVNDINNALKSVTLPNLMTSSGLFGSGLAGKKLETIISHLITNKLPVNFKNIIDIPNIGPKMSASFVTNWPKFIKFAKLIQSKISHINLNHSIFKLKPSQQLDDLVADDPVADDDDLVDDDPVADNDDLVADDLVADDEDQVAEDQVAEDTRSEDIIQQLYHQKPTTQTKPNSNPFLQHIVLSDFRGKSEITKQIEALGGSVDKNLTKKTNILVVGDDSTSTNKKQTAITYGIKIMVLDEFKQTYGIK